MFSFAKALCIFLVLFLGVCLEGCISISSQPKAVSAPISNNIPILLYHHVTDFPEGTSPAKRRWALSPQKFDDHMGWLASNGFHPITVVQLLAHYKDGEPLPPKPIVLTFDDGWKNQYSQALPILQKYNFKATFFIITDSVGHSAYVDWDQIKEMLDAGMDIQSHTVTHARLSTLTYEKLVHEISTSKKELEGRLGKPITVLAYPYGSYDDDVVNATKEAGYEAAVKVSGLNNGYFVRKDQTFTLERYAIEWGDDLAGIARWKRFE